jgi:large subunit ribosomal protein L21
MYAIIRAGGKQAKVSPGDIIDVERIKSAGETVTFVPLLVVDEAGTSITDRAQLAKMSVTAKVLGESRGPKIDIFKYKNKTGYRRRQGHRQTYTTIEITAIETPKRTKAVKTAEKPATSAETQPAAEEAPVVEQPEALEED